MAKTRDKLQFGDFQTPRELASQACQRLVGSIPNPATILEPTCGIGSFLVAAANQFEGAQQLVGLEINPNYAEQARGALQRVDTEAVRKIICDDFFTVDWKSLVDDLPQPLLIIGNPPWVTNSELGAIGSNNLPVKSNFKRDRGIDAITGKGNFDISEWMMHQVVDWLNGKSGALAMLCKTSVARKVLREAWKNSRQISNAAIYEVDARKHFDAAVDACFLVLNFAPGRASTECDVFSGLDSSVPGSTFGIREGMLISDTATFELYQSYHTEHGLKWRSGIKHDCAKVMQLHYVDGVLTNGFEEPVEIESEYVYPLLKSSDLANNGSLHPRRWVIVPQQFVGETTDRIQKSAPRTWDYLMRHASLLDGRSSSIYKGKPRFSIFGVGSYSFTPWKVAISGLYKSLRFRVVGPCAGKPMVLDDTCYLVACESESNANLLCQALNSSNAQNLLSSLVFWDDKRPITSQLLCQLDLPAVVAGMGLPTDLPELRGIGSNAECQGKLFA